MSSMDKNIICCQCDRTFTQKKNLNKHVKKFHPGEVSNASVSNGSHNSCPICKISVKTMDELHIHFQTVHVDIKLLFEKKLFYSDNDFDEWKVKIDMETVSSFISLRQPYKFADGRVVTRYYCHRSGKCKDTPNRQRHVKNIGFQKLGHLCPAQIVCYKTIIDDVVEIEVTFQSTHVGHTADVGRLRLTPEEREQLAHKLSLGIPKTTILTSISKQFSPSKRISFTTRKDLHNVSRDFKIDDEVVYDRNDAMSVDIRVKKMQEEQDNPILIYKPVGEPLVGYPCVNPDEFLLGIMNDAQCKLLELYGDTVMIDSTHGMNQYGFQLTTLMVSDSNHEGFPVAVLFSTRTAAETFVPFFIEIKNRLPNFKPKLFMSDDAPAFYNAFSEVFGEVQHRLLCAWHVKRAWHVNLYSKIKIKETRDNIKADLMQMLHETDLATFRRLSEMLMNKLSSCEDTLSFSKYFQETYMKREEQWAYCHRLNLQVNTNMKLERWHRELKYEEACGKIIKRLDKALSLVLGTISKKIIGRIVSLERTKLTSRVMEIRKRHEKSKELSAESVIEMVPGIDWVVQSSQATDSLLLTYNVNYGKECGCDIRCVDCKICIHKLSCTCPDYCIRYVICKHIHLVAQNFSVGPSVPHIKYLENDDVELCVITDPLSERRQEEILAITGELKKNRSNNERQAKVVSVFQDLLARSQASDVSKEELRIMEECQKTMLNKLASANREESLVLGKISKRPANAKIDQQHRFFKGPKKPKKE